MPYISQTTFLTGNLYVRIAETVDRDGYETGFRLEVTDANDNETVETFPTMSQALARAAVLVACDERNIVPV